MKNVFNNIKSKLVKSDGTLNGKIVSGLVGLVIILAQQICVAFGLHFKGDTAAIVALINTVLTMLGLLGVLSDPTPIIVPEDKDEKAKK